MKKAFSVGILTLASLWLTPGTSSAGGSFGVFTATSCWPFNCCASCKCCSTICIKPYNAFSPTCSGTLYCDGFCPLGTPPGCGFPPQSALPGLPCDTLPPAGSCCGDDGCAPAPTPPVTPGGSDVKPTANPLPFVQPAPLLEQNTSRVLPNQVPYYGPIQVGYYYPMSNPAYNYHYTQPMAVPYYWNGGGR
jgi:hypothetical protein